MVPIHLQSQVWIVSLLVGSRLFQIDAVNSAFFSGFLQATSGGKTTTTLHTQIRIESLHLLDLEPWTNLKQEQAPLLKG